MTAHTVAIYTAHTVAIYLVDRAYGGPEEGGWWYDYGNPSDEHAQHTKGFADAKEAYDYANELNNTICAALNEGRRPMWSVLSDGEYRAIVQRGNPKPFPETIPHYE